MFLSKSTTVTCIVIALISFLIAYPTLAVGKMYSINTRIALSELAREELIIPWYHSGFATLLFAILITLVEVIIIGFVLHKMEK